jgi:flavin-dependent dehydrogenase
MGILAEVLSRGCPVDDYHVVAPNGKNTTAAITDKPGAVVIPRLEFDDIGLRCAVRSGAAFEPHVTVDLVAPTEKGVRVHAENGRTFDARVAVIATGAATGVLRRSRILKHQPAVRLAARAYFEDLQQEVARAFQLRLDGVPNPGYGWIFPTGRNAANVGVGFKPRPSIGIAPQVFARFVGQPALAAMLKGSKRVGPVKGYPIRVDFRRSPTFGTRTLLVGEAAGLVNPLTGEGIDYAMESGMIAAEHVVDSFESGLDLDETWAAAYDRKLRARFDKIFQFSEWIHDWYCKPAFLNLLVPLASRHPELRQLLANIVLGEREPRGYNPAGMLVRLLMYLARHP